MSTELHFGGHAKVVDRPREFHRTSSGKKILMTPQPVATGSHPGDSPSPATRMSTPRMVTRRSFESSASPVADFRSPLASTGRRHRAAAANASLGLDPAAYPAEQRRSGRRTISPFTREDSLTRRGGLRIVHTPERERQESRQERTSLLSCKGVPQTGGKHIVANHANRTVSHEMISTTGCGSAASPVAAGTAGATREWSLPPTSPGGHHAAACGKKIAASGTKNALSDWGKISPHRGRRCTSPAAQSESLMGILRPAPRAPTPTYTVTAPFATDN